MKKEKIAVINEEFKEILVEHPGASS